METAQAASIRIEDFRATEFFRGKNRPQRILILSYSWGVLTYILLAVFYSIFPFLLASPNQGFSFYLSLGLGFVLCSPLFGLLMSLLTENTSLLKGAKNRAQQLVSSGAIDLADPNLEFWSPAMVTVGSKGPYFCLLRLAKDHIAIDYFGGAKTEHQKLVYERNTPIEPSKSINPFVVLLYKPNIAFKVGKNVVRCQGLNEFLSRS